MLTIGYFHLDFDGRGIDRFLGALSAIYPDARVVNCAIPCPQNLMMSARTQAYAQLRRTVRGDLILLDTDVLATRPVELLVGGDWHIGLTRTREETPLMKYNGGVIFLRDSEYAEAFMSQVQYCATVLPADFGDWFWYVDQLALTLCAKGNPYVKVFGGEYNYIPQHGSDAPESAYFIHYKGKKRKAWMMGEQHREAA